MKNNKVEYPFQIMALAVPAAEAAAGKNWLPTLILALAAFLLCSWVSALPNPEWKWLYPMRRITIAFLLAWSLEWTHSCWPGGKSSYVVPGALLMLAMYAVWKGTAKSASTVLRYGMYLILAALALLGISLIKMDHLRPTAQLPDMRLATVLLLPLLASKSGTWVFNPIGAVALLSAIVTGGAGTLYDYSRSLSLAGVIEHMESLAAVGITVGYFSFLCFLLDGIKREENNGWHLLAAGVGAYGLSILDIDLRHEIYALMVLLLWAVIPVIWGVKEKMKKKEKSA